ncbi:hypothetical protein BH10PSE9_BH10PSE9_09540 [soil metagenome]
MFTSIENLPRGAVGVRASGRVTHAERTGMLAPTIERAVAEGGRVRLLYVAGPDFAGYDCGGLFDDAVFGTRHFSDFEKIAFVAEDGPFNRAVQAMKGLMPAELRIFPVNDIAAAKAWLAA